MKFQGSQNYVATQDLMLAVNAAITLKRPLLVKGEPGTGKTMLAEEVAQALDMPLLQWHIKSTTKAQQGLYEYDAVSRLRDSQLGDEQVKDIHNYIVKGVLWQAFTADQPVALLIDEIDKADIEFPNDLLRELDRMEFYVYETRELVKAKHRPLVFITSNNEKELPDAFLRRCFFHYIKFPDADTMKQIVDVHFPGLKKELLTAAMKTFYDVRNLPGLKKKPSTSELLDWLKLLVAEDIPAGGAAKQGRQGRGAAAGGRAAQERAGRDPVREAGVHATPQPLNGRAMNPLLLEGLADAVGFVGGALLGYWLGLAFGLDIFDAGYSNASIGGILLVGLGGGAGCSWPGAGARRARRPSVMRKPEPCTLETPLVRLEPMSRGPRGRPRSGGARRRTLEPAHHLGARARRNRGLHRSRAARASDEGHMLPFAVRDVASGKMHRHHPLPRHRAGGRARWRSATPGTAGAGSAATSTPPASCC